MLMNRIATNRIYPYGIIPLYVFILNGITIIALRRQRQKAYGGICRMVTKTR